MPLTAITAYLFHWGATKTRTSYGQTQARASRQPRSTGMGFTFDDTMTTGELRFARMIELLIAKNASNAERIFPYIGGEEVNDESDASLTDRYVINFGEMTEGEARQWPDLLRIVEEEGQTRTRRSETQQMLLTDRLVAICGRVEPRLLLQRFRIASAQFWSNSQATAHLSFAFIPLNWVFANALNRFCASTADAAFVLLQSRPHEVWARFFGSSMKDDLRYTPSDCFETFPFPENFETDATLEAAGKAYYEFRAALMVRNNEGLTKTYNRFHDPERDARRTS